MGGIVSKCGMSLVVLHSHNHETLGKWITSYSRSTSITCKRWGMTNMGSTNGGPGMTSGFLRYDLESPQEIEIWLKYVKLHEFRIHSERQIQQDDRHINQITGSTQTCQKCREYITWDLWWSDLPACYQSRMQIGASPKWSVWCQRWSPKRRCSLRVFESTSCIYHVWWLEQVQKQARAVLQFFKIQDRIGTA